MRVWSVKFGVGGIQLGSGYETGGLRVKLRVWVLKLRFYWGENRV